jgi:putative ABC transport system permease protein
MSIASLAFKSFRNRKFSVGLALASITLSIALLLGVEILRNEARSSFSNTVSGTDLIVGARGGTVNLLLYSVFRIGNPTNNVEWDSYNTIRSLPGIKWSIPLSMGDSHRGYRVIGTDNSYLEHYRYADGRALSLRDGEWFEHGDDMVLGAEVAESLGYRLGDAIVVAHGAGDVSFITHAERPFRVSGILERTGTPVDRTLHVSLQGFDNLHAGQGDDGDAHDHDPLAAMSSMQGSAESHGDHDDHDDHDEHAETSADHESNPEKISAFLLGLESRSAALGLLRRINQFEPEPLTAIMPGATLLELWEVTGLVERTLRAISALVVAVGLLSMLIILLASSNERRREMAVLRAVGAGPRQVLALILGEAAFITFGGILLGIVLVESVLLLGRDWIAREFGLFPGLDLFSVETVYLLLLVAVIGCLVGLIPALRIYRYSLIDGMTVKT